MRLLHVSPEEYMQQESLSRKFIVLKLAGLLCGHLVILCRQNDRRETERYFSLDL